jgi:hypothetical protein
MNAPANESLLTIRPALLLELVRRASQATDASALRFMAVNDTHLLAPYRQAALWFQRPGVTAVSGVVSLEKNAPYMQWLDSVCKRLVSKAAGPIRAEDLTSTQAAEWGDWLPENGLWLPIPREASPGGVPLGGLLLVREDPWTAQELAALTDWMACWRCAYHALVIPQQRDSWSGRIARLKSRVRMWPIVLVAVLLAVCLIPVRISVLAPAELVPADPIAIRAPLDGVLQEFFVKPNQKVSKGSPLFAFDDVTLGSKYDVAMQALVTAEAELQQYEQQGLADPKARAQLPSARGAVAERRSELALLKKQRARSQVVAPHDGYVLFDDPAEWIGKPVTTGERIMRIAALDDKEIEAWLSVADAIPLEPKAEARLYLSASPLDPISGHVRYLSHDAVRRPDGVYSYRVRATLDAPTEHRIGLKGTVRLHGEEVTLAYWVIRRPLATIREFLGI